MKRSYLITLIVAVAILLAVITFTQATLPRTCSKILYEATSTKGLKAWLEVIGETVDGYLDTKVFVDGKELPLKLLLFPGAGNGTAPPLVWLNGTVLLIDGRDIYDTISLIQAIL